MTLAESTHSALALLGDDGVRAGMTQQAFQLFMLFVFGTPIIIFLGYTLRGLITLRGRLVRAVEGLPEAANPLNAPGALGPTRTSEQRSLSPSRNGFHAEPPSRDATVSPDEGPLVEARPVAVRPVPVETRTRHHAEAMLGEPRAEEREGSPTGLTSSARRKGPWGREAVPGFEPRHGDRHMNPRHPLDATIDGIRRSLAHASRNFEAVAIGSRDQEPSNVRFALQQILSETAALEDLAAQLSASARLDDKDDDARVVVSTHRG
jgi:hypothetical protein